MGEGYQKTHFWSSHFHGFFHPCRSVQANSRDRFPVRSTPVGGSILQSCTVRIVSPASRLHCRRRHFKIRRINFSYCSGGPHPPVVFSQHCRGWQRDSAAAPRRSPLRGDDRPPGFCQSPPPGSGQVENCGGGVPLAEGCRNYQAFQLTMVISSPHGTQAGWVVAALRRLSPPQHRHYT